MRLTDGEWGSTTVEVVVVLPAFMLAVLLAVQVGMVVYAAQTAEAAAQEAVEAARGEPDRDPRGVARAHAVLDATGAVTDPQIDISRGLDSVTAEVSGVAPQVVPGLGLRVAASATGPVERFVAEPDRP